jgi:hypothetical protein
MSAEDYIPFLTDLDDEEERSREAEGEDKMSYREYYDYPSDYEDEQE